ncbi:MAG: patatin family protein [Peptococcaceae bacterium]|jgi:predicted patatin/cPLA2 family phospholipase|nr:patatin family protein [Peptococcaceae bacterium]
MWDAGLILEGGGMRGVYTAGVLDFFLDKGAFFRRCYAVSAGACHACSYLARQRGRAFRISVNYLKDKRYCGIYSLVTTGNLFGTEMVYDLIPNQLDPFDHEAFEKSETEFYITVTNCRAGAPEYVRAREIRAGVDLVRASSSLPLVSQMVELGGQLYLDGGVSDSIPIRRSVADGQARNVVILTQDPSYRKKPNRLIPLFHLRYRRYPALVARAAERHSRYNETLDFIRREEEAGRAFVIQPRRPVGIRRIEKNRAKLTALYEEGYRDGEASWDRLLAFLS